MPVLQDDVQHSRVLLAVRLVLPVRQLSEEGGPQLLGLKARGQARNKRGGDSGKLLGGPRTLRRRLEGARVCGSGGCVDCVV